MPALSAAVFDLVDRIAAAATVSDVWDAYLGAAQTVGLGYGVACRMPASAKGDLHVLAEALPGRWLEEYRAEGLVKGDLLTERIRNSTASFQWAMRDWDGHKLTPIQKRWRDHNLAYNILGGLCILDSRKGEDLLMMICGPDGPLHAHDRMALFFAGREAIWRLKEFCVAAPDPLVLSPRERECLQWAAGGKTDWEIGQILSLSEKTVNVYIERAKTKYGVKTRAQAIVTALRAGMIAA